MQWNIKLEKITFELECEISNMSRFFSYYNQSEVKDFESNEVEWPIFYTFLIIDGVFKSNPEQIEEYQAELRKCMYVFWFIFLMIYSHIFFIRSFFWRYADVNGDPVITWYYQPDGEGGYNKSPNGPLFLWGQAVFVIAQLLTSGLLHINELDIIRRYLPSYNRPRKGGRYSAFQVNKSSFNEFCCIWASFLLEIRRMFFHDIFILVSEWFISIFSPSNYYHREQD